jgi:hypothetical protein
MIFIFLDKILFDAHSTLGSYTKHVSSLVRVVVQVVVIGQHFLFDSHDSLVVAYLFNFDSSRKPKASVSLTYFFHHFDEPLLLINTFLGPLHDEVLEDFLPIDLSIKTN